MRIVVIDDEIDVRDVLTNMLKIAGFDVVAAPIGPGLIEYLGTERFELVVTDLAMPHLTGWDVAAWVRCHRPGVPVVAVTGHADYLRADRSFADFALLLAKPIRRRELVQAIEDAKGKWVG
jgi:CheY-like chemotaxis protein